MIQATIHVVGGVAKCVDFEPLPFAAEGTVIVEIRDYDHYYCVQDCECVYDKECETRYTRSVHVHEG